MQESRIHYLNIALLVLFMIILKDYLTLEIHQLYSQDHNCRKNNLTEHFP